MAIKETYKHLKDLLVGITHDLDKAEGGNKAASQRVRTGTVKLEKIAKLYRKESIKSEKQTKGTKKPAKKAASHKTAHKKPATKSTATKSTATKSSPAKSTAGKAAAKVKAKPKAKAIVRPRALSFKRPSAKLPLRKAHR